MYYRSQVKHVACAPGHTCVTDGPCARPQAPGSPPTASPAVSPHPTNIYTSHSSPRHKRSSIAHSSPSLFFFGEPTSHVPADRPPSAPRSTSRKPNKTAQMCHTAEGAWRSKSSRRRPSRQILAFLCKLMTSYTHYGARAGHSCDSYTQIFNREKWPQLLPSLDTFARRCFREMIRVQRASV